LKKRITRAQIINSAKRLKEYGIKGYYYFMLGLPKETKDDVFQTIEAIREILKILPDAQFQGPTLYTPYPGTPLHALYVNIGFTSPESLEDCGNFDWDNVNLPWLTKDQKTYFERVRYTIAPLNRFNVLIDTYFKIKADILFKTKIALPCPEKNIFDALNRWKLI
jgi:radical SAM superfamily enzyme YgiQ (UPF0313 family)